MASSTWLAADDFSLILAEAQSGSQSAFEKLFSAYAGAVTGFARMQGMRDPEDTASETFISVLKSIRTFSGDEAAFRSWLFTIAHRRIIDQRRSDSRRLQVVRDEPRDRPSDHDTEGEVLVAASTARVRELCNQLVPDQRDVLLLRLVGGLTIDEIATQVDKSPGAVKALQRRGLGALRRILAEGVPL